MMCVAHAQSHVGILETGEGILAAYERHDQGKSIT